MLWKNAKHPNRTRLAADGFRLPRNRAGAHTSRATTRGSDFICGMTLSGTGTGPTALWCNTITPKAQFGMTREGNGSPCLLHWGHERRFREVCATSRFASKSDLERTFGIRVPISLSRSTRVTQSRVLRSPVKPVRIKPSSPSTFLYVLDVTLQSNASGTRAGLDCSAIHPLCLNYLHLPGR